MRSRVRILLSTRMLAGSARPTAFSITASGSRPLCMEARACPNAANFSGVSTWAASHSSTNKLRTSSIVPRSSGCSRHITASRFDRRPPSVRLDDPIIAASSNMKIFAWKLRVRYRTARFGIPCRRKSASGLVESFRPTSNWTDLPAFTASRIGSGSVKKGAAKCTLRDFAISRISGFTTKSLSGPFEKIRCIVSPNRIGKPRWTFSTKAPGRLR
jgi:hypothetical protein